MCACGVTVGPLASQLVEKKVYALTSKPWWGLHDLQMALPPLGGKREPLCTHLTSGAAPAPTHPHLHWEPEVKTVKAA